MTGITGILLAAGQSTRFGSDKLLHTLDNEKTIAQQAAETIIQACSDSVAVIALRTVSPTKCPYVSLMALKKSISISNMLL